MSEVGVADIVAAVVGVFILPQLRELRSRKPYGAQTALIDQRRGQRLLLKLLTDDNRLLTFARVDRQRFDALLERLPLRDGPILTGAAKLLIFLNIVGQGSSMKDIQKSFRLARYTVSKAFQDVLHALLREHRNLVKSAKAEDTAQVIARGAEYSAFEGAVGALGGTHISLGTEEQDLTVWRNENGEVSQNVLAVVNFNMRFTYVLAGWEGSARDGRVLADAWERDSDPLKCPEGCYYLADADYSNDEFVMVPYRGVSYHLREQGASDLRPSNHQELYNIRHSSLRNVVERTMDVFKSRFQIFNRMRPWPIDTQVMLVYACTALHNFLLDTGEPDGLFSPSEDGVPDDAASHDPPSRFDFDSLKMKDRREKVAERLWREYVATGTSVLE